MSQRTPYVRRHDKCGQIWDIYLSEKECRVVWHAKRGPVRGIGWASVMTSDEDAKQLPFAVLEDIEVDSELRNRGVGSILLTEVIAVSRERGHTGIEGELSSADSGHFDKLKHFYEKFGFTVTFRPPEHPRYDRWPGEIRSEF